MEYSQAGPDVLGDGQPGERVRERLQQVGGNGMSANQFVGEGGLSENVQVPDEPGPALAGRTPLVGTLRRAQDVPVLRDQLGGS